MTIGGNAYFMNKAQVWIYDAFITIAGYLIASDTLEVSTSGTLTVGGDLNYPAGHEIIIYGGTLSIGGNFTTGSNVTFDHLGGGVLNVTGNATFNDNTTTTLISGAKMTIGGNLTIGNGATLDAKNGDVTVGGN